jgi:hypothetical protein
MFNVLPSSPSRWEGFLKVDQHFTDKVFVRKSGLLSFYVVLN